MLELIQNSGGSDKMQDSLGFYCCDVCGLILNPANPTIDTVTKRARCATHDYGKRPEWNETLRKWTYRK